MPGGGAMIGRRVLPTSFVQWNRRWGAPFGHANTVPIDDRLRAPHARFGPFAFQGNNTTRAVEFPWAYHAGLTSPGMKVLEVGGGLSGLQFVWSLEGCRVTNVDPGDDPGHAWDGSPRTHQRLNEVFGTDVTLVQLRVEDFDDIANSYDRIFCVSVIEHLPDEAAKAALANLGRLLAPGGLCVLTVDLCLDIEPFTEAPDNEIGVNKDVAQLVTASGLELVGGFRDELYGFAEFNPMAVLRRVPALLVGTFHIPVVAQMLVLRKQ